VVYRAAALDVVLDSTDGVVDTVVVLVLVPIPATELGKEAGLVGEAALLVEELLEW
jgi:hypothetical protein